jgi:ribosomal protein L31E
MISPLDSQPLNLVMEMLENIAKRHNIPFNIDLINFADDIYKIAYERGAEDVVQRLKLHEQHHAQARENLS